MGKEKSYNLKLILAYDGTGYKGWQKTFAGPSVEEALKNASEIIFQHPIELQAASRTDAGVHAVGQVVNFFTSLLPDNPSRLPVRFNQLLPKEITVLSCEQVPETFHPTVNAISKEYRYYVCLGPTQFPHHRLYSWHCPCVPNRELMRQAAELLIGRHDFSSFCNFHINSRYPHFTRDVTCIEIIQIDDFRLCFIVKGEHFLYKMVRNLVGTIINVGQNKIPLDQLPKILAAKDRKAAGVTAPAHGLFLQSVSYS